MTYQAIPGLTFNGHPVAYDDGVSAGPSPSPSPIPPPVVPTPTIVTSYNYNKLRPYVTMTSLPEDVHADRMFLLKSEYFYRGALAKLPGAHQLFFDILCDPFGRFWSDAVPTPVGFVNNPAMKQAINWIINDTSYNGGPVNQFDLSKYNGPLKAIYDNLVAAKLNGTR